MFEFELEEKNRFVIYTAFMILKYRRSVSYLGLLDLFIQNYEKHQQKTLL